MHAVPARPLTRISSKLWCVSSLSVMFASFCALADETIAIKLGELDRVRIESLCEDLGSASFARRERASNALMAYGVAVAVPLQETLPRISDPEAIDRAREIIETLVGEDNAKKTAAFLSGENVEFRGWRTFGNLMGDNLATRELFVEVRVEAREFLDVLDSGTPREISIATARLVDDVNKRMVARMAMPGRGEVVALFLPTPDKRVPILATHERLLFRLLNQNAVSLLSKHAQLKAPFGRLVEELLIRSRKENRFDAILHGITMKLEVTETLARATLREALQDDTPFGVDSVALSMRAICESGEREDARLLEPFLKDTRQAADDAFRDGRVYRIQLSDVAMASIAILYNVPLPEIGYTDAIQTPSRGLYPTELGFPADEPALRTRNQKKLMQIVAEIRKADQETND